MRHGQLNSIGCENPCSVREPLNTAACEVLSSQVENFTLNFYGEIFKTEVNGEVQWSLPGRLDVGLPLNPRGVSEPLGCYFLRLLEDGMVGAQGEKGIPGTDACNGSTPYVQVLAGGFPQPMLDAVFAITVTRNPSLLPGMDVFIEGSGWYEIITSDGKGNVTLALRKAVVNPHSWVNEGTVLLPSGKVGGTGPQGVLGIQGRKGGTGDKGIPGDTGPQGDPAPASASGLPAFVATIPHYNITFPGNATIDGYQGGMTPSAYQPVTLLPGSVPCRIKLPHAGTYLVMARVGWGAIPIDAGAGQTAAQAQPGLNFFKVRNLATNTDIPQSEVLTFQDITLISGQRLTTFVTTLTSNNSIQLYAKSLTGPGVVAVHYFRAFRLSS